MIVKEKKKIKFRDTFLVSFRTVRFNYFAAFLVIFTPKLFCGFHWLTSSRSNALTFCSFICFHTSFRPTNGGRLIWLMRRGMCTDQSLFSLGIKPDISRIRPCKELLVTGAQSTWFHFLFWWPNSWEFIWSPINLPNILIFYTYSIRSHI